MEDGRIFRLAPVQPLGQCGEDMGRLAQHLTRIHRREARCIFEENGHEVRQLAATEEEAAFDILLSKVDHRLSALAAVAMDMFEQVKRKRSRTIKQFAVRRLQVEQFLVLELTQQGLEARKIRDAQ
jgi:hypothetical protein